MQTIKDVLPFVISQLQSPEFSLRSQLVNQWGAIAGSKLAPHTKPYLNQQGRLNIWVENSTLAFEINQKYRPALLKRAQAALGETAVKEVRVYVGQLHR